jgi:hypothetical protein
MGGNLEPTLSVYMVFGELTTYEEAKQAVQYGFTGKDSSTAEARSSGVMEGVNVLKVVFQGFGAEDNDSIRTTATMYRKLGSQPSLIGKGTLYGTVELPCTPDNVKLNMVGIIEEEDSIVMCVLCNMELLYAQTVCKSKKVKDYEEKLKFRVRKALPWKIMD